MKTKKKKINASVILLPLLLIGTGAACGWMIGERNYSRNLEDLESEINDLQGALEFSQNSLKKYPKEGELDRLKTQHKKLQQKKKQKQPVKKIKTQGVVEHQITSPEFSIMEQSVSKFAAYMQQSGVHITALKNSHGNQRAQYKTLTANGSYNSLIAAIDAASKLKGLIISKFSIRQVHEDGELALELTYTFNIEKNEPNTNPANPRKKRNAP